MTTREIFTLARSYYCQKLGDKLVKELSKVQFEENIDSIIDELQNEIVKAIAIPRRYLFYDKQTNI